MNRKDVESPLTPDTIEKIRVLVRDWAVVPSRVIVPDDDDDDIAEMRRVAESAQRAEQVRGKFSVWLRRLLERSPGAHANAHLDRPAYLGDAAYIGGYDDPLTWAEVEIVLALLEGAAPKRSEEG